MSPSMNLKRKFVGSFLLLALLFTAACNKRKVVSTNHPPAPTIQQALPDAIPEKPEEPVAEVVPVPVATAPPKARPSKRPGHTTTGANSNTKKTNPPPNNTTAQAPAPASAPPSSSPAQPPASNNQTIANAGPITSGVPENAPDLAIAAAIPSAKATRDKEDTAHMVDATENALKGINRSLNDEEQAMRTQIESYLQQSRKATADGDFEKAYNLAKKAQQLAEALIKK